MYYQPYGPFEINKKALHENSRSVVKNVFWDDVPDDIKDVKDACGCYVVCLRAGKGYTPWYVGMAQKQSFDKECFNHKNITQYLKLIAKKKGTLVLFFLAKKTSDKKNSRFCKPTSRKYSDIEFLEDYFIGTALQKNPELLNQQKTRYLKNIQVPGFMNSPKGAARKKEAVVFKDAVSKN